MATLGNRSGGPILDVALSVRDLATSQCGVRSDPALPTRQGFAMTSAQTSSR